ncbi:MDR family MFS transporter [Nocardia miyunensis]|uniref:MDR family MFS transporter n=1 Tax=Nocardia miyunensis TaxID=282684 RepID=UPI000A421EEE|nr:MDR family MFS transporter [Nocardia miyunensis]
MSEDIQDTRAAAEPTVAPNRFRLTYAGILLVMLLSSLDQTIVSTALPTIVGDLHGIDQMSWVTTAYILAVTIVMPVYGRLGDLIGRKSVFAGAIAIFLVGSVVAAAAPNMAVLIAGRVVQGAGGGGLMITAQAIVADLVPPRKRATYLAPVGALFGISTVAGPLLGGWFTDGIGWRWCFWINVPGCLLALAVCVFALELPRRSGRVRVDYSGIVLMAIAVVCTVLVADWGGTAHPWSSALILGLIAGAVAGWIAFLWSQSRAVEPIVPLRLFTNRIFDIATLIGMICVGVGTFAAISYSPTYMQMVYGYSASRSGLLMLPMVAGIFGASSLSATLMSRTGRYKPFPILGSAFVLIASLLFASLRTTTPISVFCLYLLVLGVGAGLLFQTLVLAVQNAFGYSLVGTATAANSFFREIGATIGVAAVGAAFTSRVVEHLGHRLSVGDRSLVGPIEAVTPALVHGLPARLRRIVIDAYHDALIPIFLYMAPLFVIGLVLAFVLPDKRLADSNTDDE